MMQPLAHPFQRHFPQTGFCAHWNHCAQLRICIALVHSVPAGSDPPFCYRPRKRPGRVAYTLILRGSASITGGPEHGRSIGPGDILRLDGRSGFQVDSRQHWEECSVSFDGRTRQALNALGLLRHTTTVCHDGDAKLVAAYDILINSLASDTDSYAQQLQLIAWATTLNRHLEEHNEGMTVVEKAKHWFIMRLQARHSVAEAATELGLSDSHLRRLFRRESGRSIGSWLIEQRIERARLLLANHSIEEVSQALGYSDRFAFSRQFKQQTGVSPGRWSAT